MAFHARRATPACGSDSIRYPRRRYGHRSKERKSGSDSNNAGLPRGAGIRAFQQRAGILAIGVSFALIAAVEGALRAYIEHAKTAWPG
jgi:hypothetical protein